MAEYTNDRRKETSGLKSCHTGVWFLFGWRKFRFITGSPLEHGPDRAKFPSSQLANHLILERQKQDAARDEVLEFTRYQQTCDTKNLWLQTSERHFLRRTVQRHVQAAVGQHESSVEERRDRIPLCLFIPGWEEAEHTPSLKGTSQLLGSVFC
uniref:cilia- and flagella-associated protein 53-like isoform X1 n=1 Tax=Monopterus albus TaxID=43700 RepID=UPI0009B3C7E7|nr:cilia- and flagella-associated protein 53-like isoform X1 [Monopterus albus]